MNVFDKIKGGLIVSCQVQRDDPIYADDIVVKMALAAQWAGAALIIGAGLFLWRAGRKAA